MRRLLLLIGLFVPTIGWALPDEFVQEGLVFEDGVALDGAHDIAIRLYANEQGGAPLFEEVHEGATFFDGYYAVSIGSIEQLSASMILRPSLYLGISIDDGRELEPRTPIVKVPAAFVADVAENVVGDITPRTVSIGDALVINEDGRWVGDPTGLRGPAGPPGEGAEIDDVIQAIVNAIEEDPGLLPFLRNTVDDAVTDSTVTFDGSRLVFDFGGVANAMDLRNNNILGVNRLRINDPGPGEGIVWDGSQASIVVSPLGGANTDGYLRLINDEGISLESNTRIQGNLTITGVINAVQSITTTVLNATTATITNANITNLNGPNGRVNVVAELNLAGDVRLSGATDFIGVIRNDGGILSGGDIGGRNFAATASITAAGNITAGNRLVAGNGGIWVGNIQVFDGNGNLVRRPIYQCPGGQVMSGTDNNGTARCVPLLCPVGQYLRGLDGNNGAICAADAGIRLIPQRTCPAGLAATAISANGTITCSNPRVGPQSCPPNHYVSGLAANGSVVCAELMNNVPADACDADVRVIPPFGGRFATNTLNSGNNHTASCAGSARGGEDIFELTLLQGSFVDFEMVAATYDTAMFLRERCANAGTEIACDDDGGVGLRSRISIFLPPGTYYLFVDGYSQNSGTGTLAVSIEGGGFPQ